MCQFEISYFGQCEKDGEPYCEEHSGARCKELVFAWLPRKGGWLRNVPCASQAVRSCDGGCFDTVLCGKHLHRDCGLNPVLQEWAKINVVEPNIRKDCSKCGAAPKQGVMHWQGEKDEPCREVPLRVDMVGMHKDDCKWPLLKIQEGKWSCECGAEGVWDEGT